MCLPGHCWHQLCLLLLGLHAPPEHNEQRGHENMWSAGRSRRGGVCVPALRVVQPLTRVLRARALTQIANVSHWRTGIRCPSLTGLTVPRTLYSPS